MPLMFTIPVASKLSSYDAQVLADNPLGYWRLDDLGAPPTQATDFSGNSNHLTTVVDGNLLTTGQAALVAGKGSSISWNDTASDDAGFESASNLLSSITFPFTVECWMNRPGSTNIDLFCSHKTAVTYYGVYISISTAGIVDVLMGDGGVGDVGSRRSYRTSSTPISNNTTQHVVVVCRQYIQGGSPSSVDIFVDGVSETTVFSSGTGSSFNISSGVVAIGSHLASVQQATVVTLDNVAFYDSALSQERITAHFNAGT